MTGRRAILYVSYDGMLEPLGQSQVLAYLERLAGEYAIHLISYEKPADWRASARRDAMRDRLARTDIAWHPLRYHKRPTLPATLFDMLMGCALALWLTLRFRVRLIHARSTIPALIGAIVERLTGARLLFDIRGFWADERVDGGLWPANGRVYRVAKAIERHLYRRADHIVTLTEASRPSIAALLGTRKTPVTIIPTCADLGQFTPSDMGRPETFTLGYVGSAGTWYCFDEMLACFRLIRRRLPDARLLVVNRSEGAEIRAMVARAGIDPSVVEVTAAEHPDVPALIRRMTAGALLIRPVPSKQASAPTKLAEYLGCGLPCLGNAGVGDVASILEREGVGVAVPDFAAASLEEAVDRLLDLCAEPDIAARCRAVADTYFSVETGADRYRHIYEMLAP